MHEIQKNKLASYYFLKKKKLTNEYNKLGDKGLLETKIYNTTIMK